MVPLMVIVVGPTIMTLASSILVFIFAPHLRTIITIEKGVVLLVPLILYNF